MKKISSKKLYFYLIYSALKRTPPKEYPDTNEMVVTVDEILPALEIASGEFITYRKKSDDINSEFLSQKVTEVEAREKINELQKEVRAFETSQGLEIVIAEMSSSALGILQRQFSAWGKDWFEKLEDFVAFKKDFEKAEQYIKKTENEDQPMVGLCPVGGVLNVRYFGFHFVFRNLTTART